MTGPVQDAGALGPVRAELLRTARAEGEAQLARAREEAAAAVREARAAAEEILAAARRRGAADGAAAAAAELAGARRAARHLLLTARRDAYDQLCDCVVQQVRDLRRSTDYPRLRRRLEARARALLGPGASLTEPSGGGVLALAPGRRVDLTLEAVAARALDRLGPEAEDLWTP
ncbi:MULTISPECIES: hypothetical protein [Streptomyces]|uniref:Uncharacterized protein n=1 Tax=Streptomyces morookaense TaxID=1970 RepID=A0A7Y7AZZ9_STRMO|nr:MULTISPECIES: hypothetical protein [Streptomyces]MCC2274402.1 hypothetical protein [Streptomyces sp. ET3-23]NVK76523.1 hypothetical protein [Streptomyces morookaense]GHF07718.1 hypothetical protein GCM10010359_06090 [Streptomyces morookaense]